MLAQFEHVENPAASGLNNVSRQWSQRYRACSKHLKSVCIMAALGLVDDPSLGRAYKVKRSCCIQASLEVASIMTTAAAECAALNAR